MCKAPHQKFCRAFQVTRFSHLCLQVTVDCIALHVSDHSKRSSDGTEHINSNKLLCKRDRDQSVLVFPSTHFERPVGSTYQRLLCPPQRKHVTVFRLLRSFGKVYTIDIHYAGQVHISLFASARTEGRAACRGGKLCAALESEHEYGAWVSEIIFLEIESILNPSSVAILPQVHSTCFALAFALQ